MYRYARLEVRIRCEKEESRHFRRKTPIRRFIRINASRGEIERVSRLCAAPVCERKSHEKKCTIPEEILLSDISPRSTATLTFSVGT